MAAVVLVVVVVLITAAMVGREAMWLRRVHRASGDPAALELVLAQRRRGRW